MSNKISALGRHAVRGILLLFILTSTFFYSRSQAPEGIAYQAVVRNALGQIVTGLPVSMQFVIHDSTPTGPTRFIQRDTVVPNLFGLINVVIGGGTIVQGPLSSVDWAHGAKFLQVEMDILGGVSYVDMGTSQMLSVPYALYAGSAANNPADTTWKKNGNNIYNSNPGNVGIGTTTSPAALTVNGYSMFGTDAPPIKMKEFTGTTPTTGGDSISFNTGIPDTRVRAIDVLVQDPVNGLLTPLLSLVNEEYSYTYKSGVFTLNTTLVNSAAVLNKKYSVLITYRE